MVFFVKKQIFQHSNFLVETDNCILTIFQIERWSEILKSRRLIAKDLDLDPQIISEIFELIHKYSVHIQTKIMR